MHERALASRLCLCNVIAHPAAGPADGHPAHQCSQWSCVMVSVMFVMFRSDVAAAAPINHRGVVVGTERAAGQAPWLQKLKSEHSQPGCMGAARASNTQPHPPHPCAAPASPGPPSCVSCPSCHTHPAHAHTSPVPAAPPTLCTPTQPQRLLPRPLCTPSSLTRASPVPAAHVQEVPGGRGAVLEGGQELFDLGHAHVERLAAAGCGCSKGRGQG